MKRIVVGVDGSQSSRNALNWAVDEARARGGRVEAVIAWQVPYPTMYPMGAVALDAGTFEGEARDTLGRVVDSTDVTGLDEPIERIVTCGGAARTLLDAAKGADLLVVGSRGHGGFAGMMLGSVGQHCVTHAPCPVVVVRPHEA